MEEMMMITKNMKQYGLIVYSDGMNILYWLDQARKEGFTLFLRDGFAELWR
jgi:hypothetical protein